MEQRFYGGCENIDKEIEAGDACENPEQELKTARKPLLHSFIYKYAKMSGYDDIAATGYGVNPALILQYLLKLMENGRHEDGSVWCWKSVAGLQKHFPYMCAGAIKKALKILTGEDGPLKAERTGKYNPDKHDKTVNYAVRNKKLLSLDLYETRKCWFDVADAVKYGVAKALILQHIEYMIKCKQGGHFKRRWLNDYDESKEIELLTHPQPSAFTCSISPSRLSQELPYTYHTIKRYLRDLDGPVLLSFNPGYGKPKQYCRNTPENQSKLTAMTLELAA